MHTNIQLNHLGQDGGDPRSNEIVRQSQIVTPDQLELKPEAMTAVVPSDTLRFVIPVPTIEGKPFVQPNLLPDAQVNPEAGKPLIDWKGNPIAGEGYVFYNFKDSCWQALKTDGQGIILFNGINEASAKVLDGILKSVVSHPSELTAEKLNEFFRIAAENGFKDRYNSDLKYAAGNLVAAPGGVSENYGIHTRTRDVCHALFLPGEGVSYQDSTGSPQQAEGNGLVVLLTKEGSSRAIQLSAFAQSYRLADGQKIVDVSEQLKMQHPLLQ